MERAIYKGPDYFNGIPARDLTGEEFANLTEEQREDLRLSPFYEVVSDTDNTISPVAVTTAGATPLTSPVAGGPFTPSVTKPATDTTPGVEEN